MKRYTTMHRYPRRDYAPLPWADSHPRLTTALAWIGIVLLMWVLVGALMWAAGS